MTVLLSTPKRGPLNSSLHPSATVYHVLPLLQSGVCECRPGYVGEDCSEECQEGWWGPGCRNECQCPGGQVACHAATGTCHQDCPAGLTGPKCDMCECIFVLHFRQFISNVLIMCLYYWFVCNAIAVVFQRLIAVLLVTLVHKYFMRIFYIVAPDVSP